MKILLSWLKDYVQFDKSAEVLAEDLSMFAHEVESIKNVGEPPVDFVLDLEITPNRGDCLSHLGIARQIAAMYSKSLNIPNIEIEDEEIDKKLKLDIEKQNICPRFTARIIDNIEIKESPKWLQDRLIAYGFRPINNIVDITNYVMIAVGQPLHAFDYDKIKDGLFRIRLSKKDEEVKTLDGKNHKLPAAAIIIEDEDRIYDLAGIMGGYTSQVTNNTKTIVLVGSIFDPVLIRRASKYLHHQTDASYRYERGADFEGTVYGVNLAASLIKESVNSVKIGKLIDQKQVNSDRQNITFSYDRINRLLGTDLDSSVIDSFLKKLHFKVSDGIAEVPSFRNYDVKIWQDLVEEVARVYGYNNISRKEPLISENVQQNDDWLKRELIKDYLKEKGFTEVYSTSFANKDKIELLGYDLEKCIEIINPIAPETQYLRPDLSLSLLSAAAKNPWAPEINIFEIEKIFNTSEENWQVGILMSGKNTKMLNEIVQELKIESEIKQIEQKVLDSYKIRKQISLVTFNIDKLMSKFDNKVDQINYEISKNKMREISKFAPTIRDISIIVSTDIESETIKKVITESSRAVLLTEKFDEFVSDKFGENKKSLAFHIWLQNKDDVVSEQEADEVTKIIINNLENKYQAKLRS